MMYSVYKLNKQGENIQPWHTHFLSWNQSVVPCPVLNCFFLTCIQISQEAGQVIWYSHLFQNFPQFIVIHTVKGFGIVNKAETEIYSLRVLEVRSKSWRYLQDPLGAPRENHSLSFQLAADSLWFMAPSLQSLPSPLATSFLCLYVFYSSVCVCPQTLASLL